MDGDGDGDVAVGGGRDKRRVVIGRTWGEGNVHAREVNVQGHVAVAVAVQVNVNDRRQRGFVNPAN